MGGFKVPRWGSGNPTRSPACWTRSLPLLSSPFWGHESGARSREVAADVHVITEIEGNSSGQFDQIEDGCCQSDDGGNGCCPSADVSGGA